MSDEELSEKQKATKWKCPQCGRKITLYIKPSYPPSCANEESHAGKSFVMEKI